MIINSKLDNNYNHYLSKFGKNELIFISIIFTINFLLIIIISISLILIIEQFNFKI